MKMSSKLSFKKKYPGVLVIALKPALNSGAMLCVLWREKSPVDKDADIEFFSG